MPKKLYQKSSIDLIIFDCDGVLVDSETISISILSDLIHKAGGNLALHQIYDALLGKQVSKARQSILTVLGVDLPTLDISDFNQTLYQRFTQDLRPIQYIHQVLEHFDIPVCVASSSNLKRVALSLKLTNLSAFFGENVFSADFVQKGKPEPDLFLLAAERMGIMPQNCLVIEDSPAGVRAAKSAGMRVIGFTGGSHAEPARLSEHLHKEQPNAIINAMTDLHETIAQL